MRIEPRVFFMKQCIFFCFSFHFFLFLYLFSFWDSINVDILFYYVLPHLQIVRIIKLVVTIRETVEICVYFKVITMQSDNMYAKINILKRLQNELC